MLFNSQCCSLAHTSFWKVGCAEANYCIRTRYMPSIKRKKFLFLIRYYHILHHPWQLTCNDNRRTAPGDWCVTAITWIMVSCSHNAFLATTSSLHNAWRLKIKRLSVAEGREHIVFDQRRICACIAHTQNGISAVCAKLTCFVQRHRLLCECCRLAHAMK